MSKSFITRSYSSFADSTNHLVCDVVPIGLSFQQCKKLMHDIKKIFWNKPFYSEFVNIEWFNNVSLKVELMSLLEACHSSIVGGHHSGAWTTHKILQWGYYWPTIFNDVHDYEGACDQCQRQRNTSQRQELLVTTILELELFDVYYWLHGPLCEFKWYEVYLEDCWLCFIMGGGYCTSEQ